MIIDRQLIIAKRKKAEIVAELRKLNFRPFPKVKKAKEAGEEEPAEDDEDEDEPAGSNDDYDYLLGMALWTLTEEKVTNLFRHTWTQLIGKYLYNRSPSSCNSAIIKRRSLTHSSK